MVNEEMEKMTREELNTHGEQLKKRWIISIKE